jgi:hypothetical protein
MKNNIEQKYFIKKGINRPITIACCSEKYLGTTFEDFNNNKFIEINKDQANFFYENPDAIYEEIINCGKTVLKIANPVKTDILNISSIEYKLNESFPVWKVLAAIIGVYSEKENEKIINEFKEIIKENGIIIGKE